MVCAPHSCNSTAIHDLFELHSIFNLVLVQRTSSFVRKNHRSSPSRETPSGPFPIRDSLMFSLPLPSNPSPTDNRFASHVSYSTLSKPTSTDKHSGYFQSVTSFRNRIGQLRSEECRENDRFKKATSSISFERLHVQMNLNFAHTDHLHNSTQTELHKVRPVCSPSLLLRKQPRRWSCTPVEQIDPLSCFPICDSSVTPISAIPSLLPPSLLFVPSSAAVGMYLITPCESVDVPLSVITFHIQFVSCGTAALSFLNNTVLFSSAEILLLLVDSNLVTKVLATVQPHTLPISGNEVILDNLIGIIRNCVILAYPSHLSVLGITRAVDAFDHREMIFQKVVLPSSPFVTFLISNQNILNEELFRSFMYLLDTFFVMCPFHRPTLEYVIASPIAMAFSSCLSFIEDENCLWSALFNIALSLEKWMNEDPEVAQSTKRKMQALFSEGFEDTLEQMMMCDKHRDYGDGIVDIGHAISQMMGSNAKRLNLSGMTPTHFCGLSSDVGNALIAGADEQILGWPPIVQKWSALLATHLVYLVEMGCTPHSLDSTVTHIHCMIIQSVDYSLNRRPFHSKRQNGLHNSAGTIGTGMASHLVPLLELDSALAFSSFITSNTTRRVWSCTAVIF
ncbi:hypothetical protein BLNAU_7228 [Blattamonas nauphoetae]|uniref:Uncharacterized protein n=1 Tax=Blattamonas nauphoetae TaxID=2049346 RepID=A0ABQ9Y231_9EUKA|nr:hypothetical protein BLNAU_7228 [Blattamonas nauphoetae]